MVEVGANYTDKEEGGAPGADPHGPDNQSGRLALPLLAGAAAATAATDNSTERRLRAGAVALALEHPTNYGDVWVALGPELADHSISPRDESHS